MINISYNYNINKEFIDNDLLFLKKINKQLNIESCIYIKNILTVQKNLILLNKEKKLEYLKDIYLKYWQKKKFNKDFIFCDYDMGLKYTGSAFIELYPKYILAVDQKYNYGYLNGIYSNDENFSLIFKVNTKFAYRRNLKDFLGFNKFKYRVIKYKYKNNILKNLRTKLLHIKKFYCLSKRKLLRFIYKKMGVMYCLKWRESRTFYIKNLNRFTYDFNVKFFFKIIKMWENRLIKNKLISYFFLTESDYILFDFLYQYLLEKMYIFFYFLYKKSSSFTLFWSFVFIRFFSLMKFFKYLLVLCKNDNIMLLVKYNNVFLKNNLKDSLVFYDIINNLYEFFEEDHLLSENYDEDVFLFELLEIYLYIYENEEKKNIFLDCSFCHQDKKSSQLFDGFIYGLRLKKQFLVKQKKKIKFVNRKNLYKFYGKVLKFLRKWKKLIKVKNFYKQKKKYIKHTKFTLYNKQIKLKYILFRNKNINNIFNNIKLKKYITKYIVGSKNLLYNKKIKNKKLLKKSSNKNLYYLELKKIVLDNFYNILINKYTHVFYMYNKKLLYNKLLILKEKKLEDKNYITKDKKFNDKIGKLLFNEKNIKPIKLNIYIEKSNLKFKKINLLNNFISLKNLKSITLKDLNNKKLFNKKLDEKRLKQLKVLIDKQLTLERERKFKEKQVNDKFITNRDRKKIYHYITVLNNNISDVQLAIKNLYLGDDNKLIMEKVKVKEKVKKDINIFTLNYKNLIKNKLNKNINIDIYVKYCYKNNKKVSNFLNSIKIIKNIKDYYFNKNIDKNKELVRYFDYVYDDLLDFNSIEFNKYCFYNNKINFDNKLNYLILKSKIKKFKKENEEFETIESEPLTFEEKKKEKNLILYDLKKKRSSEEIILNIKKRQLLKKKELNKKKIKQNIFYKYYIQNLEELKHDFVEKKKNTLFVYHKYMNIRFKKNMKNFFDYYFENENKKLKVNNQIGFIKRYFITLKKLKKKFIYKYHYKYFFRNNIINKQRVLHLCKGFSRVNKYILFKYKIKRKKKYIYKQNYYYSRKKKI